MQANYASDRGTVVVRLVVVVPFTGTDEFVITVLLIGRVTLLDALPFRGTVVLLEPEPLTGKVAFPGAVALVLRGSVGITGGGGLGRVVLYHGGGGN